jgi:hypothetical protein
MSYQKRKSHDKPSVINENSHHAARQVGIFFREVEAIFQKAILALTPLYNRTIPPLTNIFLIKHKERANRKRKL